MLKKYFFLFLFILSSVSFVSADLEGSLLLGGDLEGYIGYFDQTLMASFNPENISFITLTPNNFNFSVVAGDFITFGFTLSNPQLQSYNVNWFINGANQTSAFNQDFIQTNLAPGNYTVNVTVSTSTNTISNAWYMEIVPVTNCTEISNAVTGMRNFTQSIGIIALVVMITAAGTLIVGLRMGYESEALVYIILRNIVIAAMACIIVVFIVSIGSTVSIEAAGC